MDRQEDPRFVQKVDDRALIVEPQDTGVKPKLVNHDTNYLEMPCEDQ